MFSETCTTFIECLRLDLLRKRSAVLMRVLMRVRRCDLQVTIFCVFHSELITENTVHSSEANDLYSEVNEYENGNTKEMYMPKENENPLYETAGDDSVFNPIYDRFVIRL